MQKVVVGGLALLGLLLLASSGSGTDAADNENAEYYYEPEQPRYSTSSSNHVPIRLLDSTAIVTVGHFIAANNLNS